MAPSKESEALAELFKTFAAAFPKILGDQFLERCIYDQVHQAGAEAPGVSFEDVVVAGRPCKWARPEGASSKHVILFMHGGGYTMGSTNGHRKLQAHLAKACNMPAISVDYRMTPEVSFPVPVDDCVNVYKWLLDQGYAAGDIVTAGDSCGGGLSSSVPLSARDKGLPMPGAAVSIAPWYDLTASGETMKTNAENDVLNTPDFIELITNRFTNNDVELRKNPIVSPLFADVKGLPPHWISAGGYDMLLDHATRFAEKLKEAGVEVVLEVHEGQQHVMEFMAGRAPEADESLRKIGEWVRKKVGA